MAPNGDFLPHIKMFVVGPSGAGKSALTIRYFDDEFDPDTAAATIGIDFKSKNLSVRGKPYRLAVFDTAGQERFRTLSTSFYRGAHGVILVYDISSRASFLNLDKWYDEAKRNSPEGVIMYLVGSKLDKATSATTSDPGETGREVSASEGQAWAEAHASNGVIGFCEASAKTGENVRRPFVEVVDRIVQDPGFLAAGRSGRAVGTVAVGRGEGQEHGQGEGLLGGCAC